MSTTERQAAVELFTSSSLGRRTRDVEYTDEDGLGGRRSSTGTPRESDAGGLPLTLVQGSDGLYDWRFEQLPVVGSTDLRGRRASGVFADTVVANKSLELVEGSMVSSFLAARDKGFNSKYGLFDLAGNAVDRILGRGRVLLIIHGTFSNSTSILSQFDRVDVREGRPKGAFLAEVGSRYGQVLCFEHPTLQVPPWINALDLSRAFAGSDASVDVICHSRGGLVTRWWLEVFSRTLLANARVVFVAAPMSGTGLASPYRLRAAMKLFTNYAIAAKHVAGLASLAVPMFAFAEVVAAVVGSALSVLAKSPVADTVVAAIPGLAAMARYGEDGKQFIQGNVELAKLEYGCHAPPAGYFAIQSNFEPADLGWRFWRAFRNPLERLADVSTDALFSGANDLVVDTVSMTMLSQLARLKAADRILDFGTSETVHHVNYFEQPETLRFISRAFAS
jgi:hypothetical protein